MVCVTKNLFFSHLFSPSRTPRSPDMDQNLLQPKWVPTSKREKGKETHNIFFSWTAGLSWSHCWANDISCLFQPERWPPLSSSSISLALNYSCCQDIWKQIAKKLQSLPPACDSPTGLSAQSDTHQDMTWRQNILTKKHWEGEAEHKAGDTSHKNPSKT